MRLLASVQAAVIMKCSLTGELSSAFLALERFLSSMLAHVNSQRLLRSEFRVASFASERLLACMELHVPLSISERIPLSTVLAFEILSMRSSSVKQRLHQVVLRT